MKSTIKAILVLVLLQLSIAGFSAENDTLTVPEKAVILSAMSRESGIYYTMVDLENNEMVIAYYFFHDFSGGIKLQSVLRTGIIVDMDKQTKINVNPTREKDE
jgi:hypothetical protein